MDIVFFGTPLFAADILVELNKKHNIVAVITQPDKPFGRKKILKEPETKSYAKMLNIPCFQPQKSSEILAILQQFSIQAIVVIAYGKILPPEITQNYFCINLHGSILPYFRGASPIQSSIINDYQHFGLSVIHMNEGLDSGDILASMAIAKEVVYKKTLSEVFKILVPYGMQLIQEVLQNLMTNSIKPIAQNHDIATFCTKLGKQDAYLDLQDSKQCYLRYLALCDIGVWINFREEVLKINSIVDYDENGEYAIKGEILLIEKNKICLSCEKGVLWIDMVTLQNKSKMNVLSFLQSRNLKQGDILQ